MARVNTTKAFEAWRKGRAARPAQAIWTTGAWVYSYRTPIAKFAKDGRAVVNVERYSVTTTCQQRGLLALLAQAGIPVVEVEGVQALDQAG